MHPVVRRPSQKRSPGRSRVSGGLLNPPGGARNRPRNKSVFAQMKKELNKHFAPDPKFRRLIFRSSIFLLSKHGFGHA
jgi:hypothetical protein